MAKLDLCLKEVLNVNLEAFIVDDVFTAEECEQIVDLAHQCGFESTQTSKDGERWKDEAFRNNDCATYHDDESDFLLVDALLDRLASYLPEKDATLNPLFRFNRFTKGQLVQPHVDATFTLDGFTSKYTLVIYLTDVNLGGQTRFINAFDWRYLDIEPKRGRILIFDRRLCHAALPVIDSCSKITMRTDIMYPQTPPL